MDFHCYVCFERFCDIRNIFAHLKKVHFFRDNAQELECVLIQDVNFSKCVSKFNTFSGLRKHLNRCSEWRKERIRSSHDNDDVLDTLIETTQVSECVCCLKLVFYASQSYRHFEFVEHLYIIYR